MTAAEALGAYLAEQAAVVRDLADQARAGDPEAVHQSRVATRRIRAVLRVFRRLLDRSRTDVLRNDLRWYAGRLGLVRDAQVIRKHLLEAVAALPPEQLDGPVAARLRADLGSLERDAAPRARRSMATQRHARLMAGLAELATNPPFRERADRPAGKALPPLVARAAARVEGARAAVDPDADPAAREAKWHEVRKKVKAARFANEAVAPALADAGEQAEAWKAVSQVLGEVQDSVVARHTLRSLAASAYAAGESTFSYGVLHQREVERQDAALTEADPTLQRARELS